MVRTQATPKRRGAYATPDDLRDIVVSNVLADLAATGHLDRRPAGRPVRVLDPACGDGRFLEDLRVRLHLMGHTVELTGCDVDATALARIIHPDVRRLHADALRHDWADERFDIVIGNPPFLSQMSSSTTRGGSSRHGGGPYADAAVEFLSLSIRLAEPDGGRVGLVLPQSILAARDAGPVRDLVDRLADRTWSWWAPEQRHFDADISVCALGFRRPSTGPTPRLAWTSTVTEPLGIPHLDADALRTEGTIGDRAVSNANFRDEYYALVPAVDDEVDGPPFVTSGLIDPGHCAWGERPVRFAKRDFAHPRVDLSKLTGRFPAWACRKLVPKVLVANQTRMVEAVADHEGRWLPGVPVTTVTPSDPTGPRAVREIEAVLTSPIASAFCWHIGAGTGLSTTTVRVGPKIVGRVPWPAGDVGGAVDALADGDVEACGRHVAAAYGLDDDVARPLIAWWRAGLPCRT